MEQKKEADLSELIIWLHSKDATSKEKAVRIQSLPENLIKILPIAKRLGLVEEANGKVFLSEDVVEGRTPQRLVAFLRRRILLAGIIASLIVFVLGFGIFSLLTPGLGISVLILVLVLILGVLWSLIYLNYRKIL